VATCRGHSGIRHHRWRSGRDPNHPCHGKCWGKRVCADESLAGAPPETQAAPGDSSYAVHNVFPVRFWACSRLSLSNGQCNCDAPGGASCDRARVLGTRSRARTLPARCRVGPRCSGAGGEAGNPQCDLKDAHCVDGAERRGAGSTRSGCTQRTARRVRAAGDGRGLRGYSQSRPGD